MGYRVRLYSRPGNDLTHRFPLIVETLARLRSRSCIIMARRNAAATTAGQASTASAIVVTMARSSCTPFDLIEFNGDDLRREPNHPEQQSTQLYCQARLIMQ